MSILKLVDTNVLVAAAVADHVHHEWSAAFLEAAHRDSVLVAAHSISECYSSLTKPSGFGYASLEAIAYLDTIMIEFGAVELDAGSTLDAIRRFAALRGVGARLYDYLIGATGEAFGVDTIVTWNVRHFDGLFRHLRVVTPAELIAPTS